MLEGWVEVEFDLGGGRGEEELGGVFGRGRRVTARVSLSGCAAWVGC